MTRILACFAVLLILSGCGGGSTSNPGRSGGSGTLFATGPIYSACQSSGRRAASRERCGCVQAVANTTLSPEEQRRGAGFFSDPHEAQEVRQSDKSRDERFWGKWRAYSNRAAQLCT
ncbi:hypothetical protein [Tateyamaria pelophila]|uniref:hypothetical protein n=1 Tax=Tateyamaria pelophila TaxID=328415 RepID=UPI001CC136B0|nr:hypothetical protein [Tateyamaria pelophila]